MAELGALPVRDREHLVDDVLEIRSGPREALGPARDLVHVLGVERPGVDRLPPIARLLRSLRSLGGAMKEHVRSIS